MPSSIFNLRVPLAGDDVFLMNTLTDAQVDRVVGRRGAARRPMSTPNALDEEARAAFDVLVENGFITPGRDHDRDALNRYLDQITSDTSELNVTVLTTLQCNFACDYCFQGDHGDYNKFADKMSLETAARVASWIERELDRVRPEKLVLTFFGGEPLLNLPVMYYLAERLWHATQSRGVAADRVDHHQRAAAHRRGRRSAAAVRPEGREDHARRRPRHAQPDAAAARRSGHLRPHHREHAPHRRHAARSRSAATSTTARSAATRRCSDFSRQEFDGKLAKVNFKPIGPLG